MLDAAAALRAPGVLASTGPLGDLASREADRRCRTWLERLATRATDLGVVVMLEPMFPIFGDHSYVHTLAHALALVADLDGATVVVDTGHLWWDPSLVELSPRTSPISAPCSSPTSRSRRSTSSAIRARRCPPGRCHCASSWRRSTPPGNRGWYEHEVLTTKPEDRVQFVRDERAWFDAIWSEGTACAST